MWLMRRLGEGWHGVYTSHCECTLKCSEQCFSTDYRRLNTHKSAAVYIYSKYRTHTQELPLDNSNKIIVIIHHIPPPLFEAGFKTLGRPMRTAPAFGILSQSLVPNWNGSTCPITVGVAIGASHPRHHWNVPNSVFQLSTDNWTHTNHQLYICCNRL